MEWKRFHAAFFLLSDEKNEEEEEGKKCQVFIVRNAFSVFCIYLCCVNILFSVFFSFYFGFMFVFVFLWKCQQCFSSFVHSIFISFRLDCPKVQIKSYVHLKIKWNESKKFIVIRFDLFSFLERNRHFIYFCVYIVSTFVRDIFFFFLFTITKLSVRVSNWWWNCCLPLSSKKIGIDRMLWHPWAYVY